MLGEPVRQDERQRHLDEIGQDVRDHAPAQRGRPADSAAAARIDDHKPRRSEVKKIKKKLIQVKKYIIQYQMIIK